MRIERLATTAARTTRGVAFRLAPIAAVLAITLLVNPLVVVSRPQPQPELCRVSRVQPRSDDNLYLDLNYGDWRVGTISLYGSGLAVDGVRKDFLGNSGSPSSWFGPSDLRWAARADLPHADGLQLLYERQDGAGTADLKASVDPQENQLRLALKSSPRPGSILSYAEPAFTFDGYDLLLPDGRQKANDGFAPRETLGLSKPWAVLQRSDCVIVVSSPELVSVSASFRFSSFAFDLAPGLSAPAPALTLQFIPHARARSANGSAFISAEGFSGSVDSFLSRRAASGVDFQTRQAGS
jgi:hypothetical protein